MTAPRTTVTGNVKRRQDKCLKAAGQLGMLRDTAELLMLAVSDQEQTNLAIRFARITAESPELLALFQWAASESRKASPNGLERSRVPGVATGHDNGDPGVLGTSPQERQAAAKEA